jgi:5-hydroxyisourate hydrolase
MGMLTTHILDIMHGRPAANMQIQLWRFDYTTGTGLGTVGTRTGAISVPTDPPLQLLKTVHTTDNGHTTSPLLQNEEFIIGRYELVFAVKAYFTSLGVVLPEPAFLDDIPIRFAIANADEHYHVPLLVSPWAYSTYRGS